MTIYKRFAVWLAIRLLASRYQMDGVVGAEAAYKTAIHELQVQNKTLRNEREKWRLKAVCWQIKCESWVRCS